MNEDPWLPMDTAPKDGTRILAVATYKTRPARVEIIQWKPCTNNGEWHRDGGWRVKPVVWKPLPPF